MNNNELIISSKELMLKMFNFDSIKEKNLIEMEEQYKNLIEKTNNIKNTYKFKNIKNEFEENIKILQQEKNITKYIINVFDIYSVNFDINSGNIESIKDLVPLIEKEHLLRKELENFGNISKWIISRIKEADQVSSIKGVLKDLEFSKLEPDTFMTITNKLFKQMHGNEQLNLAMDGFLKYNSINFIKDLNINALKTSINDFENLANEDKLDIFENIGNMRYYTNSKRELELTEPAKKFNKDIYLGTSEEVKAWASFILKSLKDSVDGTFSDYLQGLRESNGDWVQLEVIEGLEELSSKNVLSEISNLDLYEFPYPIQVLSENLLKYNANNLSNIIDMLDKLKPEEWTGYINNIIDNGLEITNEMINNGLDVVDAAAATASLGKTMLLKKALTKGWEQVPDFIKDKIPYYKKVQETRKEIVNTLKEAITNKLNHEDIKNFLESKLGVFATIKDDIIENLGNKHVKSSLKVFENTGIQIISENLDKQKNRDISFIEKDMYQLNKFAPSNQLFTTEEESFEKLSNFEPYYIGTKEELLIESKNKLLSEDIFVDFQNGTYPLKFFKEHLSKIELDPILDKQLIGFKKIVKDIENGISPNLLNLKEFIDNDFNSINKVLSLGYENPKKDIIEDYSNTIRDYYSNIYARHFFNQDNVKLKFERETFLEDLLVQIDKATTPNHKKEYYLDSFISINHKDGSNYYSYNVNEDYNKKLNMLELSKNDLFIRMNQSKDKKAPQHMKKFAKNFEDGYIALEIIEDYIKIDRIINSGDIAFIKDVDKYMNDSFELMKYNNNDKDNEYLKFLKNEFKEKINEFKERSTSKEFSNNILLETTNKMASENKLREIKDDNNNVFSTLTQLEEFTFSSNFAPEKILQDKTLNKSKNSRDYLEIGILTIDLKNSESTKWIDIIKENEKTITPFILNKVINSIDLSINVKKELSSLLNSNELFIESVINNKSEDKSIQLIQLLSKEMHKTIDYYLEGLKFNCKINDIDVNIKKLIILSNYDRKDIPHILGTEYEYLSDEEKKFIDSTSNELIFETIKEDLSYKNKELSYFDEKALVIIEKKKYILKANNKLEDRFNDEYNNKYLGAEFFNKKMLNKESTNNNVFNLKEFTIDELNTINKSKYVKQYFSSLFLDSMDNSIDKIIIKKIKNNSFDSINLSDESLKDLRENSKFSKIDSIKEEINQEDGSKLFNHKYFPTQIKTDKEIKTDEDFINDLFDNNKEIENNEFNLN